jgi:hypothetical protein
MPAPIDEVVNRRVVQQWLAGEPREKITADNNIAAGTVSIIVDEYKAGLDNFDLDSFRELTLEAKKRGISTRNLASFFRLYNFFRSSGAKENEVESFIINVNSGYLPPGKAIGLINQIYEISKSESVPPDQLPNYVRQKIEEKQTLDERIKEADAILQSKNVNIETINEHIRLNEKLNEYNLSFQDIDKLLNVLVNAKENGFDGKKIVAKLKKIQRLENKEEKLKRHCGVLSEQVKGCNNILPLAQKILALNIDINQLLVFDTAVNQIAKEYGLPPSVAAFRLIRDIKDYNKIGGVKKELSTLCQQVFVVNGIWANQNKAMMAMINLQSRGITEDRILQLNNLLDNNGYKASSYTGIN